MNRLLIFLPFLSLLCGCFEPVSGCLDVAATNFNASADKDCCCEYPQLVLDVVQRYDTLSFTENTAYPAPLNGHLFRLKSVTFYLSDFQLVQNGSTYTIGDTIHLRTFGATHQDTTTQTFNDDFLLIRRLSLSNQIGDFRQDGTFETARFRLGLSEAADRAIPRLAPSGHPLRPQADSLWHGPGVGYIFAQVVLARDTAGATVADTLSFSRADLGDLFLQNTAPVVHTTGYDFHLRLLADYKKLLAGIDLTVQDISAWKSQMIANLPTVFTVSQ